MPTAGSRNAARLDVRADKLNDAVHRRARLKDRGYAHLFQRVYVLIRDDAAHQHQHVIDLVLLQQFHHARHNCVMSAGKNRQANDVDVFLQGSADNHLRCLTQTGVDYFHPSVSQRAGDHFSPAIVSIKTRLRNQHADFGFLRHVLI